MHRIFINQSYLFLLFDESKHSWDSKPQSKDTLGLFSYDVADLYKKEYHVNSENNVIIVKCKICNE